MDCHLPVLKWREDKVPTHKELTVPVRIECLKNESKYTRA